MSTSTSMSMSVCCSLDVATATANAIAIARHRQTPPTLTATNNPLGVGLGLGLTRRNALFLSIISFSSPSPSFAFSIGIPGPMEWLKDQKRKSSNFLLLPIYASRQTLNTAFSLLTAMDSDATATYNLEQLQTLLKSAARDCIPSQRNPFVAFQAQTGVEVCTFRLIVNNASSLLSNRDPVKLEAEAVLDDLIRYNYRCIEVFQICGCLDRNFQKFRLPTTKQVNATSVIQNYKMGSTPSHAFEQCIW